VTSPKDGAVYIQTRSIGLFRCRHPDAGHAADAWEHLPVALPGAPPDPHLLGIGVMATGRLLLVRRRPLGGAGHPPPPLAKAATPRRQDATTHSVSN
jgi:hypothetical protein